MDPQSALPAHLRELFPKASDGLLRLFQAAEENASFLRIDLHTVRDWLDIAGYEDEILHALLLLLILALEEGSLCIELAPEGLSRRLQDLVPAEEAKAWAERIVADLERHAFEKLIGTTPEDQRPVIRYQAHGRRYLYFQKFLRHELEFSQIFRARLLSSQVESQAGDRAALIREVLDENPLRTGGGPLVLDPDQRRAVELALSRNLTLISGGPGTGKTSIVLTLLRCVIRGGVSPDRIALAAPTGRAAQRLTEAVRLGLQSLPQAAGSPDALLADVAATTLHQLLEYVPSRDHFRKHAENPLEADIVIIDEVSMVGMVLMARLFQALRPEARLILLGDKDQLPSVDAGAVLANLISDEPGEGSQRQGVQDALVILQTNHRSEPHIRAVAAAVNRRQVAVLDDLPILTPPAHADATWTCLAGEKGVRFLEQTEQTPGELRRLLELWAHHAYLAGGFRKTLAECMKYSEDEEHPRRQELLGELFRLLDRTRLLTLIREGPWGCVEINRYLDRFLRPRFSKPGRGVLFPGAPVLVTRNDHARQLYNGDVGLTVGGPGGGLRVALPRQGSYLTFPADALPPHELGFALTVHKSQGSEYGRVLLVFPPTGGRRLLTKELVYTGLTRAKDLAILCATREVMGLALQRKCVRESGLL